MTEQVLLNIGVITYWAVAVPGTIFVLTYLWQIVARHMKTNSVTWHMIVFTAGITTIAMDLAIRKTFFPESVGSPWLYRGVMAVIAFCMIQRCWLLWKYQVIPNMRRRRMLKLMRAELPGYSS